jgi:hypothetical protein
MTAQVILLWTAWQDYGVHDVVDWARQHGGEIKSSKRGHLELVRVRPQETCQTTSTQQGAQA